MNILVLFLMLILFSSQTGSAIIDWKFGKIEIFAILAIFTFGILFYNNLKKEYPK